MKIQLTDSAGNNPLVLVHGPATATDSYAQGPIGEDTKFSSTQLVQVAPLTRSTWAKVFYRSNHQATYPFAAVRQFASLEAALLFAAKHALDVQAMPILELHETTKKIKLHGAISACEPVRKGISVTINYVFTYGKVEEVSLT